MSNSNFCRNCGARLERNSWRAWLRGNHCETCARRLGSTRTKALVFVVIAAVTAFAFGRYLRPAPPPLIVHRAANSPLSDAPADPNDLARDSNRAEPGTTLPTDDVVYLCGARTRKGTPCRRRVHFAGERCYQHKGMPAMVALEKLTIRP